MRHIGTKMEINKQTDAIESSILDSIDIFLFMFFKNKKRRS